ncbi:MAG: UDP-3-O-(3-hydroxymyristoyl)glucosamine N-acyltransferase, partial [Planctomycetales bacterium]|nr:UDP-3-O-(3-hydroxymyristoyl)glucosamine N-acyltransferase [Planctomycetales bacterium]
MTVTLGELAALVGGELRGDAGIPISGAATLRECQLGEITLAADERLARELDPARVSAVLVPEGIACAAVPSIVVPNVHQAFSTIVAHFRPVRDQRGCGVSPAASVSPSAKLGPDVVIHPMATIGDDVVIGARTIIYPGVHVLAGSTIGEDVSIFPNAVLYENTKVGDRSVIHAGAVLGAFGFGYETVQGRHVRGAQLGYVEIGADVEIGAGTTIDRAKIGETLINSGTRIDNQVMIGHNCQIGRHNILISQVGFAGSVSTGDYVVCAGQAGIADHVHLGTGAIIGAKAGVHRDMPG